MARFTAATSKRSPRKNLQKVPTRPRVAVRYTSATHKRIAFVSLAAVVGFIVAYYHLAPTNTQLVPTTSSIPQHTTTAATHAPSQQNPLFAAHPTWIQDYHSDGARLDTSSWSPIIGLIDNTNQEQQYYTDSSSNLRVENKTLRLIATYDKNSTGKQYKSARLETQGKQSFRFGRFDVTAKLPRGVGTWPAIWLLPANNTYANLSPATKTDRYKNGGEIDIIESVGYQPGMIYGVAHTASDAAQRPDGTGSYNTIVVPHSDTTFSKYSLLWTPTNMTYEVNDVPFYTYSRPQGADYKTWPFDQPFYMIINLAMGGTWGGMDTQHFPGNGIDNTALPASLDIQSIYYYPYQGK